MLKYSRLVGGAVGGAGVVWGGLLAGLDGQPGFVLVAAFGLLVLSLIGAEWSEIAAKFGDSEMTVKRRIAEATEPVREKLAEVAAEVQEAPDLPKEIQDKLVEGIEEAQDLAEAAASWRGLPEKPMMILGLSPDGGVVILTRGAEATETNKYEVSVRSRDGKPSRAPARRAMLWPLEFPSAEKIDGPYEVTLSRVVDGHRRLPVDRAKFILRNGKAVIRPSVGGWVGR